ncbi:hypothetical protein [Allomuricauda sp. NBRC 101325]|uniref:hypothetical protein n=1 Tax=Allomuricauda sp. NBRC 101325 TaxID=1113758 RepID=UPI0024A60AAC|nr:hypothetical protein [Muricauda sp. NBRC 101325]GLU44752.1 hypothetical protein Musp01_23760 [Muricauda sp. NBRC 101325]
MDIEILKETIQDCNINFLIGSGLSMPYLSTLNNVETLLTQLSNNGTLDVKEKEIIRASILIEYFDNVIYKNIKIVDSVADANLESVLDHYKLFLKTFNTILYRRKSSLLNKQVNLFTTNIDVFFERAIEETQVEFNDGFSGRFNPIFSLTNFKKSFFKKSLHYDNTTELPVFNLLKVHGSLTWKSDSDSISYSDLFEVEEVQKIRKLIKKGDLIEIDKKTGFAELEAKVKGLKHKSVISNFLKAYDKLAIVNPTKEKFRNTILNLNYYELLRIFANELEKENTILFAMGFSFADEHVREILLRAANSNPTLLIKVLAHTEKSGKETQKHLFKGNENPKYNNIEIITPVKGSEYDFETINNEIFVKLLETL